MPIHFEPPWCRPFCSSSRLLQRLHQLFEAAKRLDQLLLFLGQVLFGEPAQPLLRQVGDIAPAFAGDGFDALEDMREDLVEAVDMALVLHQCGAGEIVEYPRRHTATSPASMASSSDRYSPSETGISRLP